ncbi:MAG: hypothetical protein AUJ96_30150 [Armatimonadetes bacterium CG2_30_66_41]|nr:MAG: hypothetical protein AUJ96_30150 [Armatimonadetes bacterium CG2_30_66_41]
MLNPLSIAGLICFWSFQEPADQPRLAQGPFPYALAEQNGPLERVADGVFGDYATVSGSSSPERSARRSTPMVPRPR